MVKIYTLIFFLFFGLSPIFVEAATLSLSPASGSYRVGQTFSVGVYVDSSSQAMNAASGVISFPADKLEVVSLSKNGSVFSFWVQEPTFSNSAGSVNFEGVVLNPGFTGSSGKILNVTFKAKASGQVNLSFPSGSVLANDGIGTNILENSRTAVITINANEVLPTPQVEEVEAVEAVEAVVEENNLLVINSSTHPDQAKWYTNKKPEFNWTLPGGVKEVRTLIDLSPKSIPTISYASPIESKKIDTLADGTYYFHLQIKTSSGWGKVAHYRVNIDSTPPRSFSIEFPYGAKSLAPKRVIAFKTTDTGSGIDYFEIKVDGLKPERLNSAMVTGSYTLQDQYPGDYTVNVTAFDRAGNSTVSLANFTVQAIEAPVITYYQDEIVSGEIIKIRGTTYPKSTVGVIFRQEEGVMFEESVTSDVDGGFMIATAKKLAPGIYTFSARVTDNQGARSEETAPLTIIVNSRWVTYIMNLVLDYLSLLILVLLILLGLISTGLWLRFKLLAMVRYLRREGVEAEVVLNKSFKLLHQDIINHITLLKSAKEKHRSTKEEVVFLEEFDKNLIDAGNIILKEIQDVSKANRSKIKKKVTKNKSAKDDK